MEQLFYCEIVLQNEKLHNSKKKKYEKDGTSSSMNKGRSGRRITTNAKKHWSGTAKIGKKSGKNKCNDRRFLANFVISDEGGFALNGAVNNHNVRMYVPANQPQYLHYSVNDSRPKLTLWLGLCGNGDMFLPRRKP